MKKRILSLLLCLAFLLALTPAFTLADPMNSGDYGDLHWEFNPANGRLDLGRADDEGAIPEFGSADNVPWKAHRGSITFVGLNSKFTYISSYAFYGCTNLASFSVPATVVTIASNAFQDCTGLNTLTIANGVKIISKEAFKGCISLTSVEIPDSVSSLGNGAFQNCSGLTSLTLGAGLTTIGSSAFSGCSALTSLTIPDNVTTLNSSAFQNCAGLTSITMPGDVTVYQNVFTGCAKVQTITLTKGRDNKVGNSNHSPWLKTSANCTVILSDGITLIDSMAFRYATKLTAITIPSSMNHVYGSAFDGCTNLKNVNYLGSKAQKAQIQIDGSNDPLTKATWSFVDIGLDITQQPADITVKSGEKATFTVKAAGKGLSYQWLFSFDGMAEWGEIPAEEGGTKPTLSFVTNSEIDGLKVKCKVRNAAGQVLDTREATLTVQPNVPEIKTQPKDVTVMNGSKAKFTVKATGKNVRYQWCVLPAGELEPGVIEGGIDTTKATLTIDATMAHNGDQYCCVVYNEDGYVPSEFATLTVTIIKTQPKPVVKVKSGAVAKFSVKATGANLGYQWYQVGDPDPIPGADKADYAFPARQALDGAQFYCKVTSGDVSVESNRVTLQVTPVPTEIKTQPKDATVQSGSKAKFTLKATGAGLSYEWYKVGDPDPVQVSNKADFNVVAAIAMDGTQYYCKVKSADETLQSDTVTLHVTITHIAITAEPADAEDMAEGKTAKFKVKATGPKLKYKWEYKALGSEDWIEIKDATKSSYSVKATKDNDGCQYRCRVYNDDEETVSKPAMLRLKHELS